MSKLGAIVVGCLLVAGGVLTWIGNPEREVSMTAAGELWGDIIRDADQLGLQLSRVPARDEMDLGRKIAGGWIRGATTVPMWEVYVDAVGQALAPHARRKDIRYEFHVIQSPEKNAFALPGGQVFVFTGLLDLMQSEAELSAVLGHEIAHVDARHAIERFQYQMRLEKLGFGDIGALVNLARSIAAAGYAQYQEFEADTLGFHYALAAGYDPNGAADLLSRMPGRYRNEHERSRRLKDLIDRTRKKHAGERSYRGVENLRKKVPRAQQEFPGEFLRW